MVERQQLIQAPDMVRDPSRHGRGSCDPASGSGCLASGAAQCPMHPHQIGIRPPEVHLVLEGPPVLGEGQRLAAEASILLAQRQVVPFHVGRIDASLPAIHSAQRLRLCLASGLVPEDHAPGDFHDTSRLPPLVDLGVGQQGMRDAHRVAGPASLTGPWGSAPDPEGFQQHLRVVAEGI